MREKENRRFDQAGSAEAFVGFSASGREQATIPPLPSKYQQVF